MRFRLKERCPNGRMLEETFRAPSKQAAIERVRRIRTDAPLELWFDGARLALFPAVERRTALSANRRIH